VTDPGEKESGDLRSLGLVLFLASLTMLMGACLLGYLIVRFRADTWPPPGVPGLPEGLWISTLLLLLGSITIHLALAGVRRGDIPLLRRGLMVTSVLGAAFVASQTYNAWELLAAVAGRPKELFSFTFIMLAGLHAIHVVGGLIPLGIVTVRAFRGRYSAGNFGGVRLVAVYWHFLDVVWIVMFVSLSA
jgi:cytochrome c oxidase subunit 3